jgi:hypothetical protein
MVKLPVSLTPLAFSLILWSSPLIADEPETLPGMDLLVYLGGWEVNGEESQEPLYWREGEIVSNNENETDVQQQDTAYEEQ